jgi:hypothetical protein
MVLPQNREQAPNTKIGKRDRSQDRMTADQQKLTPVDRERSRKIRDYQPPKRPSRRERIPCTMLCAQASR